MKAWKLAMLWTSLAISACNETAIAPPTAATMTPTSTTSAIDTRRLSPDDPSLPVEIGEQSPPAGVPPEYQAPTMISVVADIGMSSSTVAYGQALVSYLGTDATAEIALEARRDGGVVASSSGSARESHTLPRSRTLPASTTVTLPAACGIIVQGEARGSVQIEFLNPRSFSFTIWGLKRDSDTKGFELPKCPPPVKEAPCSVLIAGGALADCNVPPPPPPPVGGGDDSSPPPSNEPPPPEPQPYYEPVYVPAGHWEKIIEYNPSTYEFVETWVWVPHNDSRAPSPDAPLAASVAPSSDGSRFAGLASGSLPSVYVIVSDAVPAGAAAVVQRHRQGPYKNVLLVPTANVRPAVFAAAMRFLYDDRAKHGESSSRDVSSELRGDILDRHIASEARANAATFTAMLGNAKQAKLGKYGTRKALHLQMASKKDAK